MKFKCLQYRSPICKSKHPSFAMSKIICCSCKNGSSTGAQSSNKKGTQYSAICNLFMFYSQSIIWTTIRNLKENIYCLISVILVVIVNLLHPILSFKLNFPFRQLYNIYTVFIILYMLTDYKIINLCQVLVVSKF